MKKSKKLAELTGIILGDGSFYIDKEHYQLDISFNLKDEKSYCKFVQKMLKGMTPSKIYKKYDKNGNCVHLRLNCKKDVLRLLSLSILKSGDKIKNKVTIPIWIYKNKIYLKSCIRGLIDTDGSVFRMSQRDYNLVRIEFKNVNKNLLNDARRALILLNFHPSKVICNKEFFISRQEEVKRYEKEIGFNNLKNKKRFIQLAPSSSGQEYLLW
jgi:intein/homing endonuclease